MIKLRIKNLSWRPRFCEILKRFLAVKCPLNNSEMNGMKKSRFFEESAFNNEIVLVSRNFSENFDFKNGCKDEFEDKTKKFAVDPEIQFHAKSILQAFKLTGPIRQRGS